MAIATGRIFFTEARADHIASHIPGACRCILPPNETTNSPSITASLWFRPLPRPMKEKKGKKNYPLHLYVSMFYFLCRFC